MGPKDGVIGRAQETGILRKGQTGGVLTIIIAP